MKNADLANRIAQLKAVVKENITFFESKRHDSSIQYAPFTPGIIRFADHTFDLNDMSIEELQVMLALCHSIGKNSPAYFLQICNHPLCHWSSDINGLIRKKMYHRCCSKLKLIDDRLDSPTLSIGEVQGLESEANFILSEKFVLWGDAVEN